MFSSRTWKDYAVEIAAALVFVFGLIILYQMDQLEERWRRMQVENCVSSMGAITDMEINLALAQCAYELRYTLKEEDYP